MATVSVSSIFSRLQSTVLRLAPKAGEPDPFSKIPLRWLLAPKATDLGFALRTTCAAFLALTLALWMEMDSPQWAAMTTWIVAQNSRGQSLSKAKWRLIGTCLGACAGVALLCALPQEPWVLFPILAIWTGGCCAFATFLRNFRSYALVLVAFTTTIIVLSGANQPDNIFMIALSRATYITLGIVCESFLAALFAPKLETVARAQIRAHLFGALHAACLGVGDLLRGQADGLLRSRALLSSIPSMADQTEFSEIEMGPYSHAGDHARAGLAAISAFLARGIALNIHMQATSPLPEGFAPQLNSILDLIAQLAEQFANAPSITTAQQARSMLRSHMTLSKQQGMDMLAQFQILQKRAPGPSPASHGLLESRILQAAIAKLLVELDRVLAHIIAAQADTPKDHFRFDRHPEKDVTLAFNNGLRAAAALCMGGLLWEVTAWPEGSTLAMFVAVTSTRFSSFENPVVAASGFLRGAVWAAVVSFFLVFWILPDQASIETLLASLFIPMLVGGLALRAPGALAATAAAYNNFLPFMVGPANHHRLDELNWLNTTPAVVLGIGLGVLVFQLVLPFSPANERWRLRRKMVGDLQHLASGTLSLSSAEWIARSGERLAQIIRHMDAAPNKLTEAYLSGAIGCMMTGILILRLHNVLFHNLLPEPQRAALQSLLHSIHTMQGYTLAPAQAARQALANLLPATAHMTNLSAQIDFGRAIGALEVMQAEFAANAVFMDTTRRFKPI